MVNTEFASLFKLSRAERLQLVGDLWDSIANEEVDAPLDDAKVNELRRRKDQLSRQPDSGRTWEQVKRRAQETHD